MSTYFCILTAIGEAKLANATALGQTLEFSQMALGDGGGSMPTPSQSQENLVNEVRRAPLNAVSVDEDNPNWIVCEQIVPADVGGWTIRELGIIDVDGDLVAVGNFPETYKPVLAEGSGRTQTVRLVLQVSNSASVTLKIDPSIVLATLEYVDKSSDEHLAEAKGYSEDAGNLKKGTVEIDRLPVVSGASDGTENKLLKTGSGGLMGNVVFVDDVYNALVTGSYGDSSAAALNKPVGGGGRFFYDVKSYGNSRTILATQYNSDEPYIGFMTQLAGEGPSDFIEIWHSKNFDAEKITAKSKTFLITGTNYLLVGDEGDAVISTNESLNSIENNSQILLGDPTGLGVALICKVEIKVGGVWGDPEFIYPNAGRGTRVNYRSDVGIIVQTGAASVIDTNASSTGHPFGQDVGHLTSAECRVFVKPWLGSVV